MIKILLFSILSFNILCGYSQTKTDSLADDLAFFAENLPKKHINLFAKISQSEFDGQISRIKSEIGSLDEETFIGRLMELTVAIADEHTRVEPYRLFNYTLPIRFTMFSEGIFVTETAQPDIMLAKLTAINGIPVEKALEYLRNIIFNQNASFFDAMLMFYINNTYILKSIGLTDSLTRAGYSFETTDGRCVNATLCTSKNVPLEKAKQFASLEAYSSRDNYRYSYNQNKNIIYFNYSNCKEDADYPFEKFAGDMFDKIAECNPSKIIVDLRYNGGGNSKVLQPFLDKLKGSYLNDYGKLYVLVGKMTFSSALLNAIDLKKNYKAILIGEPTAGSINHYGEIQYFTLPGTKATVVYSTKYFEEWPGHDGPLNPDVRVGYSISNFQKGIDEALEYVYNQK